MDMLVGLYMGAVVVLGIAGAAKIARPHSAVSALRSVGLPADTGLVRVIGITEIVIAGTVLWPGGRPAAGAVTVAYLGFAGFATLVRRNNKARGTATDCGCFGLSGTPVTRRHILLNVVLAAAAAVMAVGPTDWVPRGPLGTVTEEVAFSGISFSLLVLVAAVLILTTLVGPVDRSGADTSETSTTGSASRPSSLGTVPHSLASPGSARPIVGNDPRSPVADDEPATGAVAIEVTDRFRHGAAKTRDRARHDTVLVFLSTTCTTCAGYWSELARPRALRGLPPQTSLVVVTKGPESESAAKVRGLAPDRLPTVMSSTAWDDYEVPGAPLMVRVADDGTIIQHFTADDWSSARAVLRRHGRR